MRVIWLQNALQNLNQIMEYIVQDNPEAASKIIRQIQFTVQKLSQYPQLGRPSMIPDVRELVISGTPYIIPYRIHDSTIEIIRVFHGAQKHPEKQ